MALSSTITRRPLHRALHSLGPTFSSPPPADQDLISAAVAILKHQHAKSRWNHLRSVIISSSSCSSSNAAITPYQFSQITVQLRNNAHLALRFFRFTVHHSLCCHSLSSYATIIHILARSRLKTEAQRLIHSAIRQFPEPNSASLPLIFETLIKTYRDCDSAPFVFDLLIKACIESKRIDQSINIVRMLISKDIFPRISTSSALIELVSKSRGCFAGYDLYNEIFCSDGGNGSANGNDVRGVVPNSNLFNVIMVGFYRDGRLDMTQEVWREMVRVNCEPNAYSYSILMAAYCENGMMEDAMRVWEEMGKRGVKHDVVAYNTFIGGLARIGEISRAEEVFREMVSSGLKVTCITFEHLINGYCMKGDIDASILLYKDMCRKDFKPESSTINALIELLCNKGQVSEALELLRTSIKRHNIFPQKKSYMCLIKGYCQEGNLKEALKLQAEMVGKGYGPDDDVYCAFVGGYENTGNEEMAQRLRKEMLLSAQILHEEAT